MFWPDAIQTLQELVSIRRLQDSMHLPEPNLLDEQLSRVEALLHLKLTPAEYATYLQSKAAAPSTPILDPAVRAAEEYYRLAQLRSQVFLEQACKKVPASSAPRILVVQEDFIPLPWLFSFAKQAVHSWSFSPAL